MLASWAPIIASGISGIFGSIFGKKVDQEFQNYQPNPDSSGTYIVIAAIIIVLIVLILILKK